jgi:hypothetical protein
MSSPPGLWLAGRAGLCEQRPCMGRGGALVNRGHAAGAELALEPVAIGQAHLEVVERVRHQMPFTSRSKRGLPRSGAKLGSIFSQPGESQYGIFRSGSSLSSAFSCSPTSM